MKKTLQLRRALRALALLSSFLIVSEASARPPRAREAQAFVESIELATQTLTLKYPKGEGPEKVIWTKQTKFVHNGEFASASLLKESANAVIFYRSPFFGKPFATKVVWTTR